MKHLVYILISFMAVTLALYGARPSGGLVAVFASCVSALAFVLWLQGGHDKDVAALRLELADVKAGLNNVQISLGWNR